MPSAVGESRLDGTSAGPTTRVKRRGNQVYDTRPSMIRAMFVATMAACALWVLWDVAIAGQIRRIPGAKALATTQMVCCGLFSLEFIDPVGIWMAASLRSDDRPIDVIDESCLILGNLAYFHGTAACLAAISIAPRFQRDLPFRWTLPTITSAQARTLRRADPANHLHRRRDANPIQPGTVRR